MWSREEEAQQPGAGMTGDIKDGIKDDGRSGGGGVCPPWICEDTLKVTLASVVRTRVCVCVCVYEKTI